MIKKTTFLVVSLLMVVALLVACAPQATPAPEVPSGTEAPASETVATEAPAQAVKKVVLIGNQRFGDKGPMDSMAAGLEQCATDFGYEVKKIESDSSSAYEEDVRGMAKEGYDLVITTFPPMTDPTKNVAAEFPEIKFAAIYQFINVEGASIPNIWDTEFHGEQAFYLMGAIAGKLSETKMVGIVDGSEQPTNNAQVNGFIKGVKDTCPDCKVSFAYVGSFEDPAKAKEIALAMIESGVDVLQTDAGNSQIGVIEAAMDKGVLVSGDVADNSAMYPEGFIGFVGVDFGANVYEACKYLSEDAFPGGTHGFMNLANNGYYIPYEALEKFGAANTKYSTAVTEAITLAKELSAKIASGELEVEFNTEVPVKE